MIIETEIQLVHSRTSVLGEVSLVCAVSVLVILIFCLKMRLFEDGMALLPSNQQRETTLLCIYFFDSEGEVTCTIDLVEEIFVGASTFGI